MTRAVVGAQGERAGPRVNALHRAAGAVSHVEARAVVVAPADQAIARRPLAPVGYEALCPELACIVERRAGEGVQGGCVGPVVRQDQAGGRIKERSPRPVLDQLGAGVLGGGEARNAAVSLKQREGLVGAPLRERVGDRGLERIALAAVLGQGCRSEAIGQGGEGPAGLDCRQLGAVADQHQAPVAGGDVLGQLGQGPRRHGGRLVDHQNSVRRERLRIAAQAMKDTGGGLGGDGGLAAEGLGGLALPGEPQHPHPRASVGVGEGGQGRRLAAPGAGLQDDDPSLAAGKVADRRALVGAQVSVGRQGRLDVRGRGRAPDPAL